jgi:hypothetical protein
VRDFFFGLGILVGVRATAVSEVSILSFGICTAGEEGIPEGKTKAKALGLPASFFAVFCAWAKAHA